MIAEEEIEPDAVSERGSPSSDTSERSSGASRKSDQVESKLRKQVIHFEEKQVLKARFIVAAAILICTFAVCAAIFVAANRGDHHTFELEVR